MENIALVLITPLCLIKKFVVNEIVDKLNEFVSFKFILDNPGRYNYMVVFYYQETNKLIFNCDFH